jgi:hypothetical protein
MKEITIKILRDGTVEFETHGIKGKTCVDISKLFEQALTGDQNNDDHVQRKLKSEYYHSQNRGDNNVQDRPS